MGMYPHAYVGLGVDLDDKYEGDIYGLIQQEEFDSVLDAAFGGYTDGDSRYSMVFIKRSFACTDTMPIEVAASWTPPTGEELEVLNRFLDAVEYTGPREVKLLLAASFG